MSREVIRVGRLSSYLEPSRLRRLSWCATATRSELPSSGHLWGQENGARNRVSLRIGKRLGSRAWFSLVAEPVPGQGTHC